MTRREVRADYIQESIGCGLAVVDYDNDGFDDIVITCYGQNILFHNEAKGVFTDVTGIAVTDVQNFPKNGVELRASLMMR